MTERSRTLKLASLFRNVSGCIVRLLPDTGARGHKKPYDLFILYQGAHISVEAKNGAAELREHQIKALDEDRLAGCYSWVFRYESKGIRFLNFQDGVEQYEFFRSWKELKDVYNVIHTLSLLIITR